MILSALLSVLALAGAPSTTHVVCNPQLPQSIELGLTVSDEVTIVNGQVVMGRLDHIELGGLACGALLYASASPREQALIRKLNPTVDFAQLVGVGLQVALHEAEHVALNSPDECQVEKVTRTKVDTLLAPFGAAAEAAATTSDAGLPAAYHGC